MTPNERMTNDPALHVVPTAWRLAEYRLEFGLAGAPTHLTVVFVGETGHIKLRFRNPHPLADTFVLTDDATAIRVLDARTAQREQHKIRVEFLTGEGQWSDFWAESVET